MQDVIACRGKLWILCKRAGHRVIINSRGDLIVRPVFAEANVTRVPGGETYHITKQRFTTLFSSTCAAALLMLPNAMMKQATLLRCNIACHAIY